MSFRLRMLAQNACPGVVFLMPEKKISKVYFNCASMCLRSGLNLGRDMLL